MNGCIHVVDLRVDTLTSLADKYAMMFLKFPLFWHQSPLLKDLGYCFSWMGWVIKD